MSKQGPARGGSGPVGLVPEEGGEDLFEKLSPLF